MKVTEVTPTYFRRIRSGIDKYKIAPQIANEFFSTKHEKQLCQEIRRKKQKVQRNNKWRAENC